MPLEIRELVIKTSIGQESVRHPVKASRHTQKELKDLKKEILVECLAEVKEWVKKQSER